MSLSVIALLVFLLAFWIAVSWILLSGDFVDVLDWRDQVIFAFWPITIPVIFAYDIVQLLLARLRRSS